MRTFDFRTTRDNTARFPRERMTQVKVDGKQCETLQVTEPFQLVTDDGTVSGERGDVIVVNQDGEARVAKADDLTKTAVKDTRTE